MAEDLTTGVMGGNDSEVSSFISDDNLCGQTLVQIVGRGHTIIAELLKLAEEIPPAFLVATTLAEKHASQGEGKGDQSSSLLRSIFGGNIASEAEKNEAPFAQSTTDANFATNRFLPLLVDFSYLRDPDVYETQLRDMVGDDLVLDEVEEAFVSEHSDALIKFYQLFDSIFQYQLDLKTFVDDLETGYFIKYTVESVLLDPLGRQLMCEAVYLYGMILILMETNVKGGVRERLLIAFHRYCVKGKTIAPFQDICKLFRNSEKKSKVPVLDGESPQLLCGDEEKIFARFPLPEDFVRSPEILKEDVRTMREIVGKHFHDNWVISLYDGTIIDLSQEWGDRFPAAKEALANVLESWYVRELHEENARLIVHCMGEIRRYLVGGVLTENYVMDNATDLLDCMRCSNVVLRWRILHRLTHKKNLKEIICTKGDSLNSEVQQFPVLESAIIAMLLLTSQFELRLKAVFKRLVQTKLETWTACRSKASEQMTGLSKYFKGENALSHTRNDSLVKWFADMSVEINLINYEANTEHSTVTGRKIQLCMQALKDLEQFESIDRDRQAKEVLISTSDLMLQMVRAASIKEDVVDTIDCITDMRFARKVVSAFVPGLHSRVSKDPSTVSFLRGFILKLASFLRWPTTRLIQSKSSSLDLVTDLYASSIVKFVRKILAIIPSSVFGILTQIVDIKEKKLAILPLKVEVDVLQEYSQAEDRYALARLTHELSIFTEGILSMEKTTIGKIKLDPRRLLEDGIRAELTLKVSEALHQNLQFDVLHETTPDELVQYHASVLRSLKKLSSRMECFRRSIEFVQDYIGIPGLKVWFQEVSRVIEFNVRNEASKFIKKKDDDNHLRVHVQPVPIFPRTKNEPYCANFMGRMVTSLLKLSDPGSLMFSHDFNGWFLPDGSEICGAKHINNVRKSLGISGLLGIERLLSLRILHELRRFVKFYTTTAKKNGLLFEQIRDGLFPEWKCKENPVSFYKNAEEKTEKLMVPVMTCLCRVGQAQLLIKLIRQELQLSSCDRNPLFESLSVANDSVLNYVQTLSHNDGPEKQDQLSIDFFELLSQISAGSGEGNPLATTFLNTEPLEGLPALLVLFLMSTTKKVKYDTDFEALIRANGAYPIDGWPIVYGIVTLLKQFSPTYRKSFYAYLAQFIESAIQSFTSFLGGRSRKEDVLSLPIEVKHAIIFATQIDIIMGDSSLHEYIPQYVLELF
eukprot:scaffold40973_cov50-Attheya_sp.AAC.4